MTTRKEKKKVVYVKKREFHSPLKRKALLLLHAGVALSFAGTLPKQFRIVEEAVSEWKMINRAYLYRIIREFEEEQLVRIEEDESGTRTVVLSERGKQRAITFHIHSIAISVPAEWDGLWRAVFFDVPESYKKSRGVLRNKLYDLGFYHWQKSVFVHPYPCRDQIDFIATFYRLRNFVRYAVLTEVTHEAELLRHFKLQRKSSS